MPANWYGLAKRSLARKEIHWVSDSIKVLATTNLYTPNQDTHAYLSDITNELASGGGYTPGGIALANKVLTYDSATNRLIYDADDISWAGATFTFRNLIVYDDTPATTATKPLLGYIAAAADQSPAGITYQVIWDALGVLYDTVS